MILKCFSRNKYIFYTGMSQKDQGMTLSHPYKRRQNMFVCTICTTKPSHVTNTSKTCENLKPSLQNGNSLQKNKDLKWTRKATEVTFGRHIEYLPSCLTSMFWIFREVLLHTYYSVSGFHNCIESCQPCPAWMGLFK